MAELELITMGESASQAEFNNTSDLLTGAQKPGFSRNIAVLRKVRSSFNAQCPMPNAQSPRTPHVTEKGYTLLQPQKQ
jgi:hypothetical protein